MNERRRQIEFGDFQTPLPLAEAVCALLRQRSCCPRTIIEPTCGEGSFLEAAARVFGTETQYIGLDINAEYVARAQQRLVACHPAAQMRFATQDFFAFDWEAFLRTQQPPFLFLGNPPWVTNAALGVLGATNAPKKSNLKGLSGLSARTGKANFDISEWMAIHLAQSARAYPFTLAMLCKTSVARKILEHCWQSGMAPVESALYAIPAMEWFGAATDACLFFAHFQPDAVTAPTALFYSSLKSVVPATRFGMVEGVLASNVDDYARLKRLSGGNRYRWRSGVKHDLAKVMEIAEVDGALQNGFGAEVDVEETHLYPLIKGSEAAKGVTSPTRHVLITQTTVGEETKRLRETAPKTWRYLEQYAPLFAERKSSIYRNQPPYCLFGIGAYSFAPYKIAISGLHKQVRFTLLPPYRDKPVFVDDTCYFVGSSQREEAELLHRLFNANLTQRFLNALIFPESKRPITAEVLNRVDIGKVADELGCGEELATFLRQGTSETNGQGVLSFEEATTERIGDLV